MKSTTTLLTLASLALPASAAVSIASVATGNTAPTIDSSYGTLEVAIDYGNGGGGTVDGITFLGTSHSAGGQFPSDTQNGITVSLASTGLGYNQNADLGDPDVYQNISYTNSGEGVVVNISGLIASNTYQIQFMLGEPRAASWAEYSNGTFGASDDIKATADVIASDVTQLVSFGHNNDDNILVTVEVSGTTTAQLNMGNDGGLGPAIGGLVIQSVPEPSTALLGGLGFLTLLLRRRR